MPTQKLGQRGCGGEFFHQKNALSGSSQLHLNQCCNTSMGSGLWGWCMIGKTQLEFRCARGYSSYTHSISLVSWLVLTWSRWQGINRKPHDATWAVTAKRHLIRLRMSPVHTQACGGLSITHLKAEFPKALLLGCSSSLCLETGFQYTGNLGCSLDPDPFRGIRACVAGDWTHGKG